MFLVQKLLEKVHKKPGVKPLEPFYLKRVIQYIKTVFIYSIKKRCGFFYATCHARGYFTKPIHEKSELIVRLCLWVEFSIRHSIWFSVLTESPSWLLDSGSNQKIQSIGSIYLFTFRAPSRIGLFSYCLFNLIGLLFLASFCSPRQGHLDKIEEFHSEEIPFRPHFPATTTLKSNVPSR